MVCTFSLALFIVLSSFELAAFLSCASIEENVANRATAEMSILFIVINYCRLMSSTKVCMPKISAHVNIEVIETPKMPCKFKL